MDGFYVIDRHKDDRTGLDVYAVWERLPVEPYGVLVGEYDSLASAKASIHILWHDDTPGSLEAWGFPEPEPIDEEWAADDEQRRP